MDETLRVKIIADTTTAQSSLKQLNKESNNLGSNTNAANAAVDKLDKALNSLGVRGIKLKGITDAFKNLKAGAQSFANQASNSAKKLQALGDSLHRFKNLNPFTLSDAYLTNMAKKSEEAANKIKNLQSALSRASVSKDFSALPDIRKQVEELATSRDKAIKKTFNEADFESLKQSLVKASRAAAKQSAGEFQEALGEMSNTVGVATERFTFKGAFESMKVEITDVGKHALSVIKKVGAALSKLAIASVIAGIIALVKNAFDVSKLGDDIDKTSQKVGMSTDAFQKWSYVLERCGISVSQLQTSMRALTRNSINNPDRFSALGIDPSGLSQQQLFDKTVKALQNVSDSTQRARLAYQLFGQSSAELMPLLNTSAAEVARLSYQYDLLGATMSGKVVRASADMQDAITDMKMAFQGLKNTLAQAIIPIITKVIVRITVFIAKINMILQALFGVELEYNDVVESTQAVTKNTNDTVTAVKKLKTLIAGFDELNIFPSQDNGASMGSFMDDLGDYGSDIAPSIGEILPPEAIAELENFRNNVLPDIKEKFEQIKAVIDDINYALSGQKWQDAFDSGNVGDLTFWDMLLDLVGQLQRGIEALFDDDRGIKGLFEEWFPVGGELPEEGWFEEWIHRTLYGTEDEIGLFEMPGIKEIKEFFDWLDDISGGALSDPFSIGEYDSLEDWFKHAFDFEWDFENSPVGKLVKSISEWKIFDGSWWSEKWEEFKKNIDPKYWWSGNDGEVIGLKQMLGFDKIEQWDIWKGSFWSGLWDKVKSWFKGNGESLKLGIADSTLFGNIKEWDIWKGSWWQEKFQGIKNGWNNSAIGQFFNNSWNGIKTWFNQNVAPKFTLTYWQGKFASIKQGLSNSAIGKALQGDWSGITGWFKQNVAPKFTITYWAGKFASIKQGLSNTSLAKGFSNVWGGIKQWWTNNVAPKFTRTYWQNKWNSIKEGLSYSSILTGVKEKWNNVKAFWNDSIKPKFTFQYWKEKWNVMVDALKNVDLGNAAKKIMNGLLQAVEDAINRCVDKVNQSGIAKFLGINLGKIWIPKFQTYAKGGVISEPTAGIMGEYPGANSNPEIVTPENKMREVFESSNEDVVNVLIQGFRQIIQAIDEKDTSVHIGDSTIAKAAARGNRQYRLQTGQSLF